MKLYTFVLKMTAPGLSKEDALELIDERFFDVIDIRRDAVLVDVVDESDEVITEKPKP